MRLLRDSLLSVHAFRVFAVVWQAEPRAVVVIILGTILLLRRIK
jgi:hypothetical protein